MASPSTEERSDGRACDNGEFRTETESHIGSRFPPEYTSGDEREISATDESKTMAQRESIIAEIGPVFDDDNMDQIPPGGYHSDDDVQKSKARDQEVTCESSQPDVEAEGDSPLEDPGLLRQGLSYLMGGKRPSETSPTGSSDEVKRLRLRLEKSEKNARKAEKSATERDIALADAQRKLRGSTSKLKDYEAVLEDNYKTMRRMNEQLEAIRKEMSRKESELDEERHYRRRQGEEFKLLADAKRDTEFKGKEKEKELSHKVFELTGGSFNATQDQLRGMLQSWRGGVNNIAPSFFTRISELDFTNEAQMMHFSNNLSDINYKILVAYGEEIYFYLCESLLFNSIMNHITNIFCIGSREALGENGSHIDEALRLLSNAVCDSPGKDIPDAKFLYQSWKASSVRILLSLAQVSVKHLAEKSSHDILLSKSPYLRDAIKTIAGKVLEDMEKIMIPPSNPKTARQMKKLYDVVATAVILRLNCSIHSEQLKFKIPLSGAKLVNDWMECVGSVTEMRGREDLVVMVPISTGIWKLRPDSRWDIVAKAKVIAIKAEDFERVSSQKIESTRISRYGERIPESDQSEKKAYSGESTGQGTERHDVEMPDASHQNAEERVLI